MVRPSFVRMVAVAITLTVAGLVAAPARAQYAFAEFSKAKAPAVIVPRLMITVQRFTRYRPDPNKEPVYDQWSWAPRFALALRGPITGGGQVSIEVTKPGKKPWLSLPVETPELAPGEWKGMTTNDQEETAAIKDVGVFDFKIVLKNELEGTNKVLYAGKFEVTKIKYALGTKPGETEFYIAHDWLLPTGYLEIDTAQDAEAPMLTARMWFKGDPSGGDPVAYVYYKGKQIFSTKQDGAGNGVAEVTLTTPGIDKERTWFRWHWEFGGVRVYRRAKDRSANNYTAHFLDKNPGDYEIKVLRGGKLARTVQFTVGPDGKIKDNGIAAKSNLSTTWMFVPVTVAPGTDTALEPAPSKAPFYGNPPKL